MPLPKTVTAQDIIHGLKNVGVVTINTYRLENWDHVLLPMFDALLSRARSEAVEEYKQSLTHGN